MKKERYLIKDGRWVRATKWDLFWNSIKRTLTRWKLIDTHKYCLVPWLDKKRQFMLSDKEYIEAQNIYKEKGTIAYIFYPCGGIAWGVKVRVLDTSEEIDITDISKW